MTPPLCVFHLRGSEPAGRKRASPPNSTGGEIGLVQTRVIVAEDRKLVESIAKIADHLAETARPKKTSHFEYLRERQKGRVKLVRQVFMSGVKIREKQLTNDQVTLLNQLKPGVYNGGRWHVIGRHADGLEDGIIEIWVRNKTQEDRGQLALEAPTLDVLLQKMIAESDAREKKAA